MPIEVGIWKMGEELKRIEFRPLDAESKLEKTLQDDISILSSDYMVIGTQVLTSWSKFIDILALTRDGKLVVVELKRDRTPREVVAQVLDYASWVDGLSYEDIAAIYAEKNGGRELEQAFAEAFEQNPPDELNLSHELVVVASELDPSTERIISYLSDNYGVPVNAVFFRYFRDGENEYLTRTWLIDPVEAEAKTSRAQKQKSARAGMVATSTSHSARASVEPGRIASNTASFPVEAADGTARHSRVSSLVPECSSTSQDRLRRGGRSQGSGSAGHGVHSRR